MRDFVPYQVGDEQFLIPKSHYIPVEKLSHYYLMLKELKANNECLSIFPNFLALANVLYRFPEFESSIEIFFYNKIISFEKGHFKWNYDKTSLAQYFGSIKKENDKTQLFWEYVEYAFAIQKGSLRPLRSDNGSVRKPSKDYMKIIKLVGTKEDKKYMDKIAALEDMFDEYSNNYFWKDDGTEMEFV